MPIYLNDWRNSGETGLLADFEIENLGGYEVVLASYTYEDYSGEAYVLLKKGGKLYEVHGGHCSCYGLEGQFSPEEVDIHSIRHRVEKGTWGEEGKIKEYVLEALDELE